MVSIITLIEGYYYLDTYQERFARVKRGVEQLISQYGEPTPENWAHWVEFAITARQQRPIIKPRIVPSGDVWVDDLVTTMDLFLVASSDDMTSQAVYHSWALSEQTGLITRAYANIPLSVINGILQARPFNLVGSGWNRTKESLDGQTNYLITGTGTLFDTAIAQVAHLLPSGTQQLVDPFSNPYQTEGGDRITSPLMTPIIPEYPTETPLSEPQSLTMDVLKSPATYLIIGFLGFLLLRGRK